METAAPIILGILVIIIVFLTFCWISIVAWHDEILDFIVKIKPFSAKVVYKRNLRKVKRNCRYNAKGLKRRIRNERTQIKEEINNSIGYCYIHIIYKENIDWLKKKGFKIIEIKDKTEYKISWKGLI